MKFIEIANRKEKCVQYHARSSFKILPSGVQQIGVACNPKEFAMHVLCDHNNVIYRVMPCHACYDPILFLLFFLFCVPETFPYTLHYCIGP